MSAAGHAAPPGIHVDPERRVQVGVELRVRRLDALYDPEAAFVQLYGASPHAFWLDSAMAGPSTRFSFIGDGGGSLGAVISYDVDARRVTVERGGEVETFGQSIFDFLSDQLRQRGQPCEELPFDFNCGLVGYFGYELKADCDGSGTHKAPLPDAAFVFACRLIAFDHVEGDTWLVCLADRNRPVEAEQWLAEASASLRSLPALRESVDAEGRRPGALPPPVAGEARGGVGPDLRLRRSRERYLEDIEECKRRLVAGETYEVCLTNKIVGEAAPDPLQLYRELRRVNPAPFGAFLRFGDTAILSSSPERFLRIEPDGWVETRPIKGTSRRGETPAEDARLAADLGVDEKSRAENVTIVDLMRNDLGMVCEPGTVRAAELMKVETYESVHQLVSGVRGRLRDAVEPAHCVRACFPPGSMTGAPKRRTMEIIDALEGEARGPYSGAIGYLGLGGGCELSVAIRTIVVDGDSLTIGAGGAIVLDSDAEDEYEEMLLKARAPMAAISFASRVGASGGPAEPHPTPS